MLYLPAMSGGAVFVLVVDEVELLFADFVVLDVSLVLDAVEVVLDLQPITHAISNAKTTAVF